MTPHAASHQVHDDLISDTDHGVVAYIRVSDVGGRIVRQQRQGSLHSRHVGVRRIDQQVGILGRADESVEDDGKAANQQVADAFAIQRTTEGNEVFELWRAADCAS